MTEDSNVLEIYTEEPTVRCGNSMVELPRLSHALLVQLAYEAPTPLEVNTLRQRVWEGVYVGDDAVKQRIKLLRSALEASGIERERIETIPGKGYRLKGPFKIYNGNHKPSATEWWKKSKSSWKYGAGIAATFVAAFTVYLFAFSEGAETPLEQSQDIRVAIMAFSEANESPGTSSVGTGLREELIGILSRHEGISSVAASSADAVDSKRVVDIGQLLDVEVVIEANVRSDNDQRRLSIRLIDTGTEELVWSGEFGQPASAGLKDWSKIVFYVSKQMFLELENRMPSARRGGTRNMLAYQDYLEGVHYLKKPYDANAYRQALKRFERALEKDSEFLLARSKKAESMIRLAMLETEKNHDLRSLLEETASTLEQDTGLAESNYAHGLALYASGDADQADNFFHRAEKRRPYLRWDINRLEGARQTPETNAR